MKIELGKTYLTRQGISVRIIEQAKDEEIPWVGMASDGRYMRFGPTGRSHASHYTHQDSEDDLVQESPAVKPPVGVIPKEIWVASRFWDLIGALERYRSANKPIPTHWIEELGECAREMTALSEEPDDLRSERERTKMVSAALTGLCVAMKKAQDDDFWVDKVGALAVELGSETQGELEYQRQKEQS